MLRVSLSEVTAWGIVREGVFTARYPSAVDTICPRCRTKYGFVIKAAVPNLRDEQPVRAACPGCKQQVRFLILGASKESGEAWRGELWLHPSFDRREPLPVAGLLSDGLAADYHDALRSFDSRLWRQAAQSARVVVEGLVKGLLADSGLPNHADLYAFLEKLPDHVELDRPIRDVGDVLRAGGNLASHFEEGRKVSPELAGEMLDLLDAFIEYLLIIPDQVESLKEQLKHPEDQHSSQTEAERIAD